MNPNTRHNRIEVLFTDSEVKSLDEICAAIGTFRSPFLRGLMNMQVNLYRNPLPPIKESRACPGPVRPASRASVDMRRQV